MAKPAAALVFGAKVFEDGSPSEAIRRRALWAAQLYTRGDVQHIIASGAGYGGQSEADCIADLCKSSGVPETAIVQDQKAQTTYDNVANALPLLRDLGVQDVVLVTDRYHAPRARLVAWALWLKAHSDCPPLENVARGKLIRASLREVPAYLAYLVRLGFRSRPPL